MLFKVLDVLFTAVKFLHVISQVNINPQYRSEELKFALKLVKLQPYI